MINDKKIRELVENLRCPVCFGGVDIEITRDKGVELGVCPSQPYTSYIPSDEGCITIKCQSCQHEVEGLFSFKKPTKFSPKYETALRICLNEFKGRRMRRYMPKRCITKIVKSPDILHLSLNKL